jgi:hypothetical protein
MAERYYVAGGGPDDVRTDPPNALTKWGKRFALILGCGALTIFSALNAYSSTTRDSSPDFALKANPNDPIAAVRMADYQLAIDQSAATMRAAEMQVKKSLKVQAINVRGLRILATIAKQRNEGARAERLIQLANKTSRRELGTQIWLVDKAAAGGDAKQTLRQYDILLRSNPKAPKLLFPALGKALSNGEIRQSFVPVIKNDPPWLFDFLSYAVYNDIDPEAQAQLFLAADGYPRPARYRVIEEALVERLVKTMYYAEAALVGQKLSAQSSQAGKQVAVNAFNVDASAAPFQWRTGTIISANSALIAGASKNEKIIEAWAQPGNRALAASKLLALPSGRYRFDGKLAVTSGKLATGSYWQISCVDGKDQRMIWRASLIDTVGASDRFVVANACRFQLLELYLEGGAGSDGARVAVSALQLESVN